MLLCNLMLHRGHRKALEQINREFKLLPSGDTYWKVTKQCQMIKIIIKLTM